MYTAVPNLHGCLSSVEFKRKIFKYFLSMQLQWDWRVQASKSM